MGTSQVFTALVHPSCITKRNDVYGRLLFSVLSFPFSIKEALQNGDQVQEVVLEDTFIPVPKFSFSIMVMFIFQIVSDNGFYFVRSDMPYDMPCTSEARLKLLLLNDQVKTIPS